MAEFFDEKMIRHLNDRQRPVLDRLKAILTQADQLAAQSFKKPELPRDVEQARISLEQIINTVVVTMASSPNFVPTDSDLAEVREAEQALQRTILRLSDREGRA
ncbi:MAG: hypothetical protein NTX98_01330 [Candidatus Doudnabacteria bacterium]|nr:hypothetical protein [Candidatus Doudnabacteria bacterium]